MPSQAMQELIDAFRDRQRDAVGQVPPTLEELRAAFAPAGRIHPVPDDVRVTEVNAGGVPAHWLAAPGADAGRVLLFLHGGGFELGSLRSDGELAKVAAEASVDVTLEVGEGLPHVYQILLGTPEAAEATERIGKFLRARVHTDRFT